MQTTTRYTGPKASNHGIRVTHSQGHTVFRFKTEAKRDAALGEKYRGTDYGVYGATAEAVALVDGKLVG